MPEEEIEEQVQRIAESTRSFHAKDGKAEDGDRVTIDYVGKIDGTPFDGGTGSDQPLVLGSKQFIPGFEDQLVGTAAGEEKLVTVTFPADYQAANLAGKEATFDVTAKAVEGPDPLEVSDETAKAMGLESLERLREIVRGQIESQFGSMTRQKVKRQLLDQLDAEYSFEAPSKLVEAEFNNIWAQVNRDLEQAAGPSPTRRRPRKTRVPNTPSSPSGGCGSGWCSQRSARRPASRYPTTSCSAPFSNPSAASRLTSSRTSTSSIAATRKR